MKRFIVNSLCLMVCVCVVHAAQPFTLQQCVDTALANNLSLLTQANNYQSSRIQYQQSLTNLSPYISGSASQGWSFGRSTGADNIITSHNSAYTSFNLNAQLNLFDGLAMKFAVDQARASMQASEAEMAVQELQIRLSVSSLYLQVLLDKQLLQNAMDQLDNTRRTLQKDSLLIAADRMAEGEIYAIQAQVAQDELSVVQSQNTLRLALLDLAQAMNLQDFETFDIVADESLQNTLMPDHDAVYRQALAHRPEIRQMEYTIIAQEAALKQRKAAYSPSLSLSAGVGSNYHKIMGFDNPPFADQLKDNYSASIGLNLSVPIYDRMSTPHAVRQQQLSLENARLSLEQRKQSLRKEIDQAYYDAQATFIQLTAARSAERSMQQAYTFAEQKYQAGRGTSYEYTTAKTNYQRALSTRLQAEYTYYFRLLVLQYYQGL